MASRSEALRPRCFVCAAAACIVGWLLLSGGCPIFVPVATDQSGNSTSQGSGDQTGGTSNPGSTGSQNTGGTGSGQTGGTDGNTSGGSTGNTGGSGGGGSNGGTDGSGGTDGGTDGSAGNTGGTDGGGSSQNFTQFSYQQIAQTGTPAPGQPDGVTFTDFGNPVIDSQGRVAFWALYGGAAKKGFGGLYVWDGSTLKRVLDDDPASAGVVPGRTTQDYFGKFGDVGSTNPLTLDLTWAGGDRLLFISPVSGEKASRGFYRWRASDANFARIADLEQIVALYPDAANPNAFSPTFALPGVSDAGIAIFGVSFTYVTNPPGAQFVSGQGVYTSNGTTVSVIVDAVQKKPAPGRVPDQGANAYFAEVDTLTTLNGAGRMLFQGGYQGGSGSQGVYLWDTSAAYRVIDNRPGASWPGLPAGATVDPDGQPYEFAIGPAGHIALHTTIQAGGNTHDAVLLWNQGAATWKELTGANGAPATALVSAASNGGQVLLLSGGNPYLASASGQTQINATPPTALQGVSVTWGDTDGSINSGGRAVVPYTRSGATGLMYWTGQSALLVADGAASVPAAGISGISTITDVRRDRPGRSGLLNDHDQVVFLATFSAGGKTVYLATAQ